MLIFAILLFALRVLSCAGAKRDSKCKITVLRPSGNYQYNCLGLTSALQTYINKGPSNATSVTIFNSKLTTIPGFTFTRFGSTLRELDLRDCGIEIIESEGLAKLYYLQKLILAGNNLISVPANWFNDIHDLRELDISFNKIRVIDYNIYQQIPYLGIFYFDYNQLEKIEYTMFALLTYLRRAKFGHNPWNWGYRVGLTWQLDNQYVDTRDDWEEWGWMSSVVEKCQGSANSLANDTTLDCVVGKLLAMEIANERTLISPETQKVAAEGRCFHEATTLVHCSLMLSPPEQSLRRSLEGLTATLTDMATAGAKFKPII